MINTNLIKSTLYKLGETFLHLFDSDGWLFKAGTAVILFFGGIHMHIGVIVVLTVMDIAVGITAALKRGEKFSSRKLRRGLLEKFTLYIILFFSILMLDKIIHSMIATETFYLSGLVTLLISLYEISSISEGLYSINPNNPVFKVIGGWSRRMFSKTERKLNQIEDLTDLSKGKGEEPPGT